MPFRVSDELLERLRVDVAIGDELLTRQDEGYGGADRSIGIELGGDGRRHVERAVVLVQTVRGFDLFHFLARRNVHAERAFHPALLVQGGLEQIEPQRFARQRRWRAWIDTFEALRLRSKDVEHRSLRGSRR